MIFRFSLYGFLKNLRFFEPFLILYFLSLGLNFFQISILISFREIVINLLEIPLGTFADMFGKKLSMIFSFVFYIFSFLIFSFFAGYAVFFAAFFFFAIGEAFRTGTHKAIIFDYLKKHHMEDQKTRIYGFTRSWSKIGSALSAVIAAVIMFFVKDYRVVFLASIVPYALNIINFTGYPKETIIKNRKKTIKLFTGELSGSLRRCFKFQPLRNLLFTGMSYEGVFAIAKEYLQPVVKTFALSLPIFLYLDNHKRTAIMIGIVYVCVFLLSSISSRYAYKFVKKNNKTTLKILLLLTAACYISIAFFLKIHLSVIPILLFLCLYAFQNIWRPIVIAQVNEYSPREKSTTILSIESQSKSFFVFLFAPLFGFLVDLAGIYFLGILAVFFLVPAYFLLIRIGVGDPNQ
ncbi:MAG: MFS transporter [Candidatus Aminicenantes bacterium]|nr:MFS transporter [Candidatus Aminicenantes bacterium]